MTVPMAACPEIIIHLVHGTWPCGPLNKARWDKLRNGTLDSTVFKSSKDRESLWFVNGSNFCEDIKRSAGRSIAFVTFTWSGKNSFRARRDAATDLRNHLEDRLCANPRAHHVVVAHSHGGTVAFKAITNPPLKGLAGVLTMGTPFVALRKIGDNDKAEKSSSDKVEKIARVAAQSWVGGGLVVCLGLASAWGLVLGPGWFGFTLLPLIAILFIVISAITLTTGADWLKPRDTEGVIESSDDPRLECPLIAYRAPGDEASYLISAAQLIDWIFGRLYGWFIIRPIDCLKDFGAWRSVIITWIMTSLAFIFCDWLLTKELQPLWIYPIDGLAYLLFFSLVLLMVGTIILLLGILFLGMATGGEALRHAGYSAVEAESLPVGLSANMANMEVLTLTDHDRRTMGLRHSLHETSVMRKRIADWLQQHRICTNTHLLDQARQLSVEEQLELVEALRHDIAKRNAIPPPTAAQKAEVDRRLAHHEANPDGVVPSSEVKARGA